MRFLALIFLFVFPAFVFSKEQVLKIGMEPTYPPFETIGTNGKPTGVSVDMAYALGDYLKRKVVIENIPFIGLIPSLITKKVDLIISSLSVTDERKKMIAFSDPYLTTGLCLLISKKSNLQNIDEANEKGRVIAVKQATTAQRWTEKNLEKAKIIVLDKESSAILEVVQGKADAFIYDQFSVYNAWQRYPNATRVNLNPFEIQKWAIGLRIEDTELLAQVNSFLKKYREDGGFEKLGDKYLRSQKEAFAKLGIPFNF